MQSSIPFPSLCNDCIDISTEHSKNSDADAEDQQPQSSYLYNTDALLLALAQTQTDLARDMISTDKKGASSAKNKEGRLPVYMGKKNQRKHFVNYYCAVHFIIFKIIIRPC